ncbi:MAG: DNA mismatch repair endonuclease MutL [Candidatus Melainabacteria bacterium]|nr:DNA mismatch repair endonuclease MutL [Candidatus Melainabacteria bacterium]
MPKVLVLPEHIASQIAAGEVIERPASVVKELVENSIDAGATQIEIAVASDCRDIRVADNGCGMEPEDAVLAFHRHATSKLSKPEDLWSLRTMGFRGEAIPSIASVSHLTCYTRSHEASTGTKVDAADGTVTATETGCASGTVMELTDLFYNVPARLKFLKKPSTEFAHIHETVQALATSFPKTVFQLVNNGEVVLKTSGSGKLAQSMVETGLMSGKEELCQVTFADLKYGMAIYGYIARPIHFRGDRKGILAIINNRPVRCSLTYKALDQAYADLIPKGKYPLAVLTITIDPNQVDVNIHPTKKEIKYNIGNDVFMAIHRAATEALRVTGAQSDSSAQAAAQPVERISYSPWSAQAATSHTPTAEQGVVAEPSNTKFAASPRNTQQLHFGESLSCVPTSPHLSLTTASKTQLPHRTVTASLPHGWRLLGCLHNTYFLVETPEGLELIEQHIVHERVIYERLLAAQATPGRITDSTQTVIISQSLNLSPEQKAALEEHIELLRSLGFDFDIPAQSAAVCTQVPLELAHKDYACVVQQIVEQLCLADSAQLELEATKSLACQAAVKNGMTLSDRDITQLLSDWLKTPRNDTCPHGRPIRLAFSMDKLFQMFHPG